MINKCPKCGADIDNIAVDAGWCPECGAELVEPDIKIAGDESENASGADKEENGTTNNSKSSRDITITFIESPVKELEGYTHTYNMENYFDNLSLGRSSENIVIVQDPEVSRYHAEIFYEGDSMYIRDRGSANGTYLFDKDDGKYVTVKKDSEVKLEDINIIRFAFKTQIKVELK